MIKQFDASLKMMEDILDIDNQSFQDIDCDIQTLLKRMEKNQQYELFVKYHDNLPVAYLGLLYVANLHYEGAWIDLIGVIKKQRKQGFGKELIKFAENRVKEKGLNILTALVKKENISSSTMLSKSNFTHDSSNFLLFLKNIK